MYCRGLAPFSFSWLNSLTACEVTERSHVSSLYNFGKDRIEITTSKSSSIITCLHVAAETCLATRYPATDILLFLGAWFQECVHSAAAQQWSYSSQYEQAIAVLVLLCWFSYTVTFLFINAVLLFCSLFPLCFRKFMSILLLWNCLWNMACPGWFRDAFMVSPFAIASNSKRHGYRGRSDVSNPCLPQSFRN
jgi:hypothetical protein